MNWKKLGNRILQGWQYFPLKLNGILLAIAALWCFEMLGVEKANAEAPSSFAPFLALMGQTALWLLLAIVGFCLLSALFCFLYFLWLRRKKGVSLSLSFGQKNDRPDIRLNALLNHVRRPWLGFVKCRLLYDDGHLTPKLALLGNIHEKNRFFRKGISGKQPLQLPDIKSYRLQGSFLYFEDLLHLFSFTAFLPQSGHFEQAPVAHKATITEEKPQHVSREDVRVNESKPIPGDFLNYKNFEGGDDIRRIVWQIYAKNRELVVRIPEQRDFYASHLTIYASFHTDLSEAQFLNAFASEMLNYYKNCIWTAIETLLKKEIPLKFVPDQPFDIAEDLSKQQKISMLLSNSGWQQEKPLSDYFPARRNGIICISSFNEPEEIRQLLENAGRETIVYFVPLSHTFRHWVSWGWIKRIFMKPPTDRLKRIRSRWPFSPLRHRIQKREKQIQTILSEHDVRFGILK